MTEHDAEARRLITDALGTGDDLATIICRGETARATMQRAASHLRYGDRMVVSTTLADYAEHAAATEAEALYELCFAGARLTAELAPEGTHLHADGDDDLWHTAIELVNHVLDDAWLILTDALHTVHDHGGIDPLRGLVVHLITIYRRMTDSA